MSKSSCDTGDLDLAGERAELIRPLLTRSPEDPGLDRELRAIAQQIGVGRATVWRWLRRLREGDGRTSALTDRKAGRRSGELQLDEDKHALIEKLLHERYLIRERPSLGRVMLDIGAAFEERGWKPPARRTVQRRLDARDPREVMLKRHGPVEAAKHFAPKVGQHVVTEAMELVQIDHTLADVILVDSVERKALRLGAVLKGRPLAHAGLTGMGYAARTWCLSAIHRATHGPLRKAAWLYLGASPFGRYLIRDEFRDQPGLRHAVLRAADSLVVHKQYESLKRLKQKPSQKVVGQPTEKSTAPRPTKTDIERAVASSLDRYRPSKQIRRREDLRKLLKEADRELQIIRTILSQG